MSLYVILLLLAIEGLASSCCEGQSGDSFSGEGHWKEEDWSGNSASSTGEDDDLTGFDSGSSANDKETDDENPRTFPRMSRTFSNKRFVTSGDGEDNSGSGEDDGSKSRNGSHENNDQGSTNEEFGSIMSLAKIGDAVDLMKKLKKAKSDEELVKKLKSGPESLGVAFKTFEQLSGLWISVMHRIWRVWKAKGAKVVMHSIVDNLMNNTGRAITNKVGDLLRKKIGSVVDSNDASGSTTLKDEGSTEPETTHRSHTLHSKTDIPVEKVSIDFIKNISKKAKEQPEKTWPSVKTVEATTDKVKVSFTSTHANDSTSKQTSEQGKKKIILENTNKNVTVRSEKSSKAVNSTSSNVSNVDSATSLPKDNKHSPKTSKTLESGDYKKTGNVSLGGAGKTVERNNVTKRGHQVTRDTETTQRVTQHVDKTSLQKKQTNVTKVPIINQTDGIKPKNSSLKLQKADTQMKDTSSDKHTNVNKHSVNTEGLHGNKNNSLSKVYGAREKIVISDKTNEASDTTEKPRVLEKLKINFIQKKKSSHLDQTNSHASQVDTLKAQRKSKLFVQNKTNSKSDSDEKTVVLSKSFQSVRNRTKGSSLLDKVVLRLEKTGAIRNSKKSENDTQRTKEHFHKKQNNSTASATTSAKSEKIVVNFFGKQETLKDNTTNAFVDVAKGAGNSHSNAADVSSQNDKIAKKSHVAKGIANVQQGDTQKKQMDGSYNTTNPRDGSDQTQNNVGHSTQVLDKDVAKDKAQAGQTDRVSDNSRNLTDDSVDSSKTKTSNDNRDLLINRKSQEIEENSQKLESSDHSPTTIAVQKVNDTQRNVEYQTLQKTKESSQEELKNDKPKSEKKIPPDESSTALQTTSRNIKSARENTSSSLTNNSTSVTSAPPAKSVSDHSSKVTREPPKSSLKSNKKDQRNSPVGLNIGRKERSETSKVAKEVHTEVVASGALELEKTNMESDVTLSSGSGASHNTDINVKQDRESDTTINNSGSGSGMPHDDSAVIQHPESHTTNDQGSGATSDPGSGLAKKQEGDTTNGQKSSVTHNPKKGVTHQPEGGVTQKPKGVVIFGPQRDVKHYPESVLTKPFQVINITAKRSRHAHKSHKPSNQMKVPPRKSAKKPSLASMNEVGRYNTSSATDGMNEHVKKTSKHLRYKSVAQDSKKRTKEQRLRRLKTLESHIPRQEVARNNDVDERIEMQSNSSRTDTEPHNSTNEDEDPSKFQQVDVLTSRTPPTSLLTTSNDDNTYSIKQIVQGPRGSSFIDEHSDERRIHSLEEKVVKLENEATVLEAAMANLVKRLLVVEQKSEHPKPTIPAFLLPPMEVTSHRQQPIHNQQQTTVYTDKDVSAKPQIPVPQYGPDKIVIPISSLYLGGERHVSTHFASIHGVDDDKETKDDNRPEAKPEDSIHVALPLGAQSVPTSEAHDVVRPIVNIIVPNNRADLLSAREHPTPTMPALLNPPKEVTPQHRHPIHSQQQTIVYIGKDESVKPQSTMPQYGPEKIDIPISSLYPGGERSVSTHSASIHEVDDDQETKDDNRPERKLEDSTHVALPLGTQSVPTSHAVVRPIVNIIVPNRQDLLSTGAICLPRCQNGGRCVDGNTCRCPTFFLGDRCERFSLNDLLERPKLRDRPYRKLQRVVLSESPDQRELDGSLRSPALEYRGLNPRQDIESDEAFVAEQRPFRVMSPSNNADAQGVTRRRQLILEI